jgi:menaquinone-9 beta-reductase
MISLSCDVLVIGGGPAGAVAATVLARGGLHIVLADDEAPAAGPADVLVTAPALAGLAAAGIPVPCSRLADVIELWFGTASRRPISGCGAAVCDRGRFREHLREAAAQAGAVRIRARVVALARDGGAYRAVLGVQLAQAVVNAKHIVLAAGAGRPSLELAAPELARPDVAGDAAPDGRRPAAGMACAQRFAGAFPGPWVTLALTTPAAGVVDAPPTCAWVLPGPGGMLTLGAARAGGVCPARPEELMGDALRALAATAAGLGAMRPAGPLGSGPLNADFTPAAVAQSGLVPVGDAAGLVNPFTGEGISYAVQSGLLAARAIAASPDDPDAARRRYARKLATTFVGYFETARHATRRYHLAWRILAAGAQSDHPFFAKGRRAILLPEGLGGLTAGDHMDLTDPDALLLGPFLAACDEVMVTTVRSDWPFLARLAADGGSGHQPVRPAVPFFAALMGTGKRPHIQNATLGAAIELALLGTLALLGPAPPPSRGRGVDWALAATVIAGDFLLGQASRLVAESAPQLSWSFADWLAELAALRAARLRPHPPVLAGEIYAALFEFPARIGALIGGCPDPASEALRDFGHQCGYAFGHAEDVLALNGQRTRLDTTLDVMLKGRFCGVPDLLGSDWAGQEGLAADPVLSGRALAASTAACETARQRALAATAQVPCAAAARILRGFAEAITAPVRPSAGGTLPGSGLAAGSASTRLS